MTVGISFTNGKSAIVITDSRASILGRQTDSVDKMGLFQRDAYQGAVFASGDGNLIEGILDQLDKPQAEGLDLYVTALHEEIKRIQDGYDLAGLINARSEIEKKTKVASMPSARTYKDKEVKQLVEGYEGYKRNETPTVFVLTGYDRSMAKIRQFQISQQMAREIFMDHYEIGSGRDGANMYFATKLQGLDAARLSTPDLAFFVVNAFSGSTMNIGVGGTPKIAHISNEGTRVLGSERTNALVNLSGAYAAEFNPHGMSRDQTRAFFHEVLESEDPHYDIMAKHIGLEERSLTSIFIPYNSWQVMANASFFRDIPGEPPRETLD